MNKINYPIILVALVAVFLLFSNSLSFDPNTGDEKLDKKLSEINLASSMNINKFISRASSVYLVDKAIINDLLLRMEPVDVLLTLQLGKVTDYSIYDVVRIYKNSPSKDWTLILKNLGIKNSSYEFAELKKIERFNENSFVNSSLSQNKN